MKNHVNSFRIAGFLYLRFISLLLIFSFYGITLMGAKFTIDNKETDLVYEVIPVRVMVEGYQNFYLEVIYTNNKLLYIDVAELFKILSVPCIVGANGKTMSGFIDKEVRTYFIDFVKNQIKIGDNVTQTKTGLLNDKGVLYMESLLFAELFGITLNFNYRALAITLKSNFELPAIKQQRIESLRKNLMKIKGVSKVDTTLQRKYHLIKFGTVDWAVRSTQYKTGPKNNQFGLCIGTELLYGEADVSINYYDQQKFDNRLLNYLWRWVDNDKPLIKQVNVGVIYSQSISFINAPVIGASIRNTPTTIRKATGYYTIHEFTEPNWDVELFINNTLADHTKADASGLFIFKVPIVYGYTTIKMKFYGPMGEERSVERTMNLPYNVMPAKEFEYGVSAGKVMDSTSGRFVRGEFNYGINRFLTVGGGLEYLSSISTGSNIPFLRATFQPFSKLTINAEYDHGVKSYALVNYYLKRDVSLEIEFTKYKEGQLATLINAPEERKAKLSIPINYKNINGFIKIDYTQLVYNTFKYNQTNIMLSTYFKKFSTNSSTQINWINKRTPYIISDFALMYRLANRYTIRNSIQYSVNKNAIILYKAFLEKYFLKGDMSISYEKNLSTKTGIINVNIRYDFNFARTNISVTQQKLKTLTTEEPQTGNMVISESAKGSLAFGRGNKYVYKSNNSSLGRGGISFYPFLDLNQNGKFDKQEKFVKITSAKITGGKVILNNSDSILSIPDLVAFNRYDVEFKDSDLENIAWRLKKKKYDVLIDPNQFKRIDVPVIPVGDIEGMAYLKKTDKLTGIGKILVKIYNKNSHGKIAETISESDGYIRYNGLEPGEYIACTDSVQLNNLNYTATPKQRSFTIKPVEDGDIVNNVDFIFESLNENTPIENKGIKNQRISTMAISPEQITVPLELKSFDIHSILYHSTNKVEMITRDTMIMLKRTILYDIQLYTSHKQIKTEDLFTQLIAKVPGIRILEMLGKDGIYHYSSGVFLNPNEAYDYLQYIMDKGWMFGYVTIYTGGKRRVITFNSKPYFP